jgi:hypothetical protein
VTEEEKERMKKREVGEEERKQIKIALQMNDNHANSSASIWERKIKLSLSHEVEKKSGDIAPHILNRVGDRSASRPGRYTPRKGTHWIRGWVGLDALMKLFGGYLMMLSAS